MNQSRIFVTTGVLLLVEAVLATVGFLILLSVPNFSQILRMSPGQALEVFNNHEATIVGASYLMVLIGLLLIPLAISMHHAIKLRTDSSLQLSVVKVFGISTGILQMVGFIGWSVVVSYLASTFFDSAASAATKESSSVVYSSFTRFLGLGVGGYLAGLLFTVWVTGISIIQLKSPIFKPAAGVVGLIAGLALAITTFAPMITTQGPTLVTLATISNVVVALWMVATAVFLFKNRDNQNLVNPQEFSDRDGANRSDLGQTPNRDFRGTR